MLIPIITWPEAKAAMDAGRNAYYVDQQDFWEVYVAAPLGVTQFMKSKSFASFPPDVTCYFSKEAAEDFETNYMPRLNQSNLGQQGE
jgi:hypothetical protein